jgi:hypothetical protein
MGGMRVSGWIIAALLVAGPAGAQPTDKSAPQPAELMREELKATGEFRQPSGLEDEATRIRPATAATEPERVAPAPPPSSEDAVQATPVNVSLGQRANELRACRAEVASDRRVGESNVTAGSVMVRWTVRADGSVAQSEVVALSDTDPALLGCVKRRLGTWTFARPAAGAPTHFEHRLTFAPRQEARTVATP